MILEQVEPPLLRATLKYCGGNQSRAASILVSTGPRSARSLRQHKIKEQASARPSAR